MPIKILNSRGFSLPEITVALGLMGGISLVTMKLMEEQSGNQALITANSQVQNTVSVIQGALRNPDTCRKMLGNVAKGTSFSTLEYGIPDRTNPAIEIRKKLLDTNVKYDKFRIESIKFQDSTTGTPSATTAELEIIFRINKKSMSMWAPDQDTNDTSIKKRLPLVVKMDGANKLSDCGPATSDTNSSAREKFCKSMGGAAVWNGATCKLSNTMSCPYGQIPQKLTSLGKAICVPIPINQVFDDTPCTNNSNSFTIETTPDGRLKVKCL